MVASDIQSEASFDSTLEELERLRYLEYFQKKLVREGTEQLLAEQKQWFQLNRNRLATQYAAVAKAQGNDVTALDNPYLAHQDRTENDSFFARQIFTPILSKALKASTKLGFPIKRPIILANAPSMEPSPAGVPSTDTHMLFIGQGTFGFCNYWAKVYAAATYKAGATLIQGSSDDSVVAALLADPATMQAIRLVLRYVRCESLVGFGEFNQEPHLLPFREMLVSAMETFIVGHELAHFFLHEQYPELNGVPPGKTLREVELFCDAVGFAICSAVGEAEENEVLRHLIGPLFLLYALKLSDDVQRSWLVVKPQISDTHPELTDRIQSLFMFAKTADPSGSLTSSMEEARRYALIVGGHVESILMNVQQ
jgi:hypothetical protein